MADPTAGAEDGAALRDELAQLATEAVNPAHTELDRLSTDELVLAMNDQDALVAAAVRAQASAIARAVDGITERLGRGGRLLYVGAGTSGRLGVLDASECPPTFGTDPDLVVGVIAGGDTALRDPVEGAEDDAGAGAAELARLAVSAADCVVGIAASGRTPYVLGAIGAAHDAGALTIGLACNRGSRLGAAADLAIEVETGPEFLAGSTRLKAGTACKLVLNMLSTLTMIKIGKTYGNIMIDVQVTNAKLRARAQRTVMAVTDRPLVDVDAALAAADGSAKLATLMLLARIDADRARALLAGHHGRLRDALLAL